MARTYSRPDRKGRDVWYVDFFAPNPHTGIIERRRERVGYSEDDANDALQSRLTDVRRGKFDGIFPEPPYILEQIKEDYLKRTAAHKTEQTLERETGILDEWLIPFFGKTSLNRVPVEMVEDYRTKRRDTDKVGPATINKEVQLLKNIARKAVEWGKTRTNLIAGVKPLKTPPGRVRYLDLEQIPKLIKACPAWLRPIVLIDMNTGFRRGEIVTMQRANLDMNNRLIVIEKTKNNERKVIPMNQTVYETLKKLPPRLDTPYLFSEKNGQHYSKNKVTMAFKRACKDAGVADFRLHDLSYVLSLFMFLVWICLLKSTSVFSSFPF